MINILKTGFNLLFAMGGANYRFNQCQICHNFVNNRIKIPSSTGLWVCYDCFSHWIEGYKPDELVFKIIKHYRKQDL